MLLMILALSGCIDSTTLVFVKKDGSGYVMETVYMSTETEQALAAMMNDTSQDILPLNMEEYKAKAAMMGNGVKLASAKRVSRKDGFSGVQAIYSFDDINQLKVSSEQKGDSNADMPATTRDATQKIPLTFEFVNIKGPKSKLVINMPPMPTTSPSETMPAMNAQLLPPAQIRMMKEMFRGMRMRIIVKVDGEILTSNAAYTGMGEKSHVKQFVTLFEMDVNKLTDDKSFMEITALSQSTDIASAASQLKNIPGVKFETSDRVEIEFR